MKNDDAMISVGKLWLLHNAFEVVNIKLNTWKNEDSKQVQYDWTYTMRNGKELRCDINPKLLYLLDLECFGHFKHIDNYVRDPSIDIDKIYPIK